jgi:hypothetical protein
VACRKPSSRRSVRGTLQGGLSWEPFIGYLAGALFEEACQGPFSRWSVRGTFQGGLSGEPFKGYLAGALSEETRQGPLQGGQSGVAFKVACQGPRPDGLSGDRSPVQKWSDIGLPHTSLSGTLPSNWSVRGQTYTLACQGPTPCNL